MNRSSSLLLTVFLPGVALAFLIPLVVFVLSALFAGMSLAESLGAAATQFRAERHPLLGAAILGTVPVVLLTVLGWLLARKLDKVRVRAIAQAGLGGIALILLWVNVEFWPGYLPGRIFHGFPHGLEFVIGPLFFAPPAMLMAMLAAWFATREPPE
jgi:hypothetical protein